MDGFPEGTKGLLSVRLESGRPFTGNFKFQSAIARPFGAARYLRQCRLQFRLFARSFRLARISRFAPLTSRHQSIRPR